ncbi:MAG: hypothetical protein HY918_00240 [Candidatus Doudnabacteria bacterium]|nr:hypothetical protein [Candidatus Doudnabacteria bacterium]
MSTEINKNNRFEVPQPQINAEGGQSAPNTRERLEGMLEVDGVTEEVKDAIRNQIALMESGKDPVLPQELGKNSAVSQESSNSDKNLSGKVLADALNGELDLKNPFDVTAQLIEQAKKQAESNKN